MAPVGEGARFFEGDDADGLTGFGVEECGGDFTVVEILEATLAEADACRCADGVGHATVYLDPDDEFLAVCAARVVDADEAAAENRHPRA